MLRPARSRSRPFAWPSVSRVRPSGPGRADRPDPGARAAADDELWPAVAPARSRWRRPEPGAHLAVEGAQLVAVGTGGVRLELPAARTLWIFRCDRRHGLAVLDRHGAALLVVDAAFDPYRVRAFADRHGFGMWLGTLSEAEPRYRLAGVERLRGARAVRSWAVRWWAVWSWAVRWAVARRS